MVQQPPEQKQECEEKVMKVDLQMLREDKKEPCLSDSACSDGCLEVLRTNLREMQENYLPSVTVLAPSSPNLSSQEEPQVALALSATLRSAPTAPHVPTTALMDLMILVSLMCHPVGMEPALVLQAAERISTCAMTQEPNPFGRVPAPGVSLGQILTPGSLHHDCWLQSGPIGTGSKKIILHYPMLTPALLRSGL